MRRKNIMLVGATGVGKSSLINAILGMQAASVGTGADPETAEITGYDCDNAVFWDTPGFGDSAATDEKYMKQITEKLYETAGSGYLIDGALLVIDAKVRDLGMAGKIIRQVLKPALGKALKNRVMVVINQADMALSGRHWDSVFNAPDCVLKKRLAEEESVIAARLYEETGIMFRIGSLCAGWTDGATGIQEASYGVAKILEMFLSALPEYSRALPVSHTSGSDDYTFGDAVGNAVFQCLTTVLEAPLNIPDGIGDLLGF